MELRIGASKIYSVDLQMSRGFAGSFFSSKDEEVILTDPLVINSISIIQMELRIGASKIYSTYICLFQIQKPVASIFIFHPYLQVVKYTVIFINLLAM